MEHNILPPSRDLTSCSATADLYAFIIGWNKYNCDTFSQTRYLSVMNTNLTLKRVNIFKPFHSCLIVTAIGQLCLAACCILGSTHQLYDPKNTEMTASNTHKMLQSANYLLLIVGIIAFITAVLIFFVHNGCK